MPPRVALRISALPPVLLATALASTAAFAESGDIRLQADLEYIYSDIETEEKATGEKTDATFSYFRRKYNIDIEKEILPYLRFRGGAFLELIDSTTDEEDLSTGFEEKTDRLWAELNWTNPLYKASAAYRRRNFEFDPKNLPSTNISREEYSGFWRWTPVGFPSIDLEYNRFRTWDDDDNRDSLLNLYVAKSRYDYRDFSADYTYTRSDLEQTVRTAGGGLDPGGTLAAGDTPRTIDQGFLTQIHNGGVRYATDLFNDRLRVIARARVNYDKLEPTGTGPIRPATTSPGAPFFLLDDSDPTTLTVANAANPLSTVNIGRNAPLNPVGVGLDFGTPTEVDTIHVVPVENLLDPSLASPGEIASVAGAFNWRVFTSDDQVAWTEQAVTSDEYSVFDNRFEITFSPQAFTRYIKVVTTPVTTASGEIRIADIEAFTTVDAAAGQEFETLTQTYNLGLRWAVTDRTLTTYDSTVRLFDTDPDDRDKTTLINGVSVQHEFNDMFYADARLLRLDTSQSNRDDVVRHTFTTSLNADYLPTLSQSLIYNGVHEKEGSRSGQAHSLFLRTNADLYRDWSMNLDLGYTTRSPVFGPDTTSTIIRLATNVSPHRTMNFAVDYLGSYDTQSGGFSGFSHIASIQAFWVPFRTLSFFASVNLRDQVREREGLRVRQQYSVNWSPFPDGQLNFLLGFNQTIDADGNESQILTPEARWQINRSTLLTLAFDFGTIESETLIRDLKVFRLNFRTIF
jgi:hypothetical protein